MAYAPNPFDHTGTLDTSGQAASADITYLAGTDPDVVVPGAKNSAATICPALAEDAATLAAAVIAYKANPVVPWAAALGRAY
jgi:hypothetical protein